MVKQVLFRGSHFGQIIAMLDMIVDPILVIQSHRHTGGVGRTHTAEFLKVGDADGHAGNIRLELHQVGAGCRSAIHPQLVQRRVCF